jgi:hypothetical protein
MQGIVAQHFDCAVGMTNLDISVFKMEFDLIVLEAVDLT